MKPSGRSGLILFGATLLYLAFLLQSLMGFLQPIPSVSFSAVLIPTFLAVALAYVVGWEVGSERKALATSAISALLLLLNPLLYDMHLLLQPWLALRGSFLALAVAAVWLPMRHWSLFMRSIILMQVFGVAFLLGGNTAGVLVAALGFWALLNRRRGMAILSFIAIVLGAWVLSEIARAVYALVQRHNGDLMQLFQDFRARYETYADLAPWSWMDQCYERFLRAVSQVSLPWLLLAGVLTVERLNVIYRERRSGPADWLVFSAVGALVSYFVGEGSAFSEIVWLLMFSAALGPVASDAIAQRELLMNRPARASAGAALLFSAAATWLSPENLLPLASVAGLFSAYIFSIFGIGAPWLVRRDRLIAVLSGATLGGWLAAGFILFRS